MLGQTISHYRIVEKIGEGGMGVVYKAEDITLGRTVALKFLAPLNADGAEARERFLREASAAAALDHPNVCTVHEIGESDGRAFLAMAFVDGVSVSEKIRDRPLKLGEALDIAIQTGEGLRAAHAKGIVHRDIKSANIMVTHEGQVKITDFGLAHLDNRTRLTRTATVVGTPAYMSPEQAQGIDTDRRTDIWSLGVLLYVMVTGREPFEGLREEAVLYSILHHAHEPITALRVGVPPELDRIVGKALAKDRDERYQHVDDILVDLVALRKRIASGESITSTVSTRNGAAQRPYPLYAALAGVSLFAIGLSVVHFSESRDQPPAIPHRRFAFTPDSFKADDYAAAISPDGRRLAYVAAGGLWVWDMNRDQPHLLGGTEGADAPFWSPDSATVGFFASGKLRKAPLDGGSPAAVCGLPAGAPTGARWSGSWSWDGQLIVFATAAGLFSVPAQGGIAKTHQSRSTVRNVARDPSFLPPPAGSREVLVSTGSSRVAVMNLETGGIRPVTTGTLPTYSTTGHILFQPARNVREIWALPFSLSTLRSTGDPFPLAGSGGVPSMASDGTLAFVDGFPRNLRQLAWLDRTGAARETIGQPLVGLSSPELSPEGDRVAAVAGDGNIWVFDVRIGRSIRLTLSPGMTPRWSPNGVEIAYSANQSGSMDILVKRADGAGEPRTLAGLSHAEYVTDWSRDGKYLMTGEVKQNLDLWYMRRLPDGSGFAREPLVATGFVERLARFSPDAKHYVYCSDESGRDEIYVRPFPRGDAKWPVSGNGGCKPFWSADGKEIFYIEGGAMWSASVNTAPALTIAAPQLLFRHESLRSPTLSPYSVSADGRRFLVTVAVEGEKTTPTIRVVQNWFAGFRERGSQ